MNIYNEDVLEMLRAFNRNHLLYVVVGGLAVKLHGYNRSIGGIDIWIKDDEKNTASYKKVLIDLGYVDIPQMKILDSVPRSISFVLNSGLELNGMTSLEGLEKAGFDECLKNANITQVFELEVPFLDINRLIESKKATFRPKDEIDILELERIKGETK